MLEKERQRQALANFVSAGEYICERARTVRWCFQIGSREQPNVVVYTLLSWSSRDSAVWLVVAPRVTALVVPLAYTVPKLFDVALKSKKREAGGKSSLDMNNLLGSLWPHVSLRSWSHLLTRCLNCLMLLLKE